MKNPILTISLLKRTVLLLWISIPLIGCKKDEAKILTAGPEFASLEIGTADKKTAYSGQDFTKNNNEFILSSDLLDKITGEIKIYKLKKS